jgi:GNAT superfamily N-acetyltransferase
MEIIFKRLTECKIDDIITAWNRGFEGYFVKIEMTAEMFFQRVTNEGLSLNLSLVGFSGEEPVAIVVNGVRTIAGKKTVWNGGTGVAPEYRGTGVSRLLMEENLKIYQEEGFEVATLEAIKENTAAIRLYERYGYEIVDRVVFANGNWAETTAAATQIKVKSIRPEQLPLQSFYKENVPWQCQWQSVRAGEAQLYYDKDDNPLGYCLFRRVWNGEGDLGKVIIYQLELSSEVSSGLMDEVLASISDGAKKQVGFMTVNAPVSNPVTHFLLEHGFQIGTEQVLMVKKL